jgi:alpha-1,2-mannosyltransferase
MFAFQAYTSDFGSQSVNVCVGKEWHRYPSSFFLPDNNWNLKFIKSEFSGQLPAPFPVDGPGFYHFSYDDCQKY